PWVPLSDLSTGAGIHTVPLVIKVRELIDKIKILKNERSMSPMVRLVRLGVFHPSKRQPISRGGWDMALLVRPRAVLANYLGHHSQGCAVLRVVRQQLQLPRLCVTGLPPSPPRDAL